jgi:hypothetical protein
MNRTHKVHAGTEPKSDPDRSTLPIVCTVLVGGQTLGGATVNKQGDAFRLHTARSGDARWASGRFPNNARVAQRGKLGLYGQGLSPLIFL